MHSTTIVHNVHDTVLTTAIVTHRLVYSLSLTFTPQKCSHHIGKIRASPASIDAAHKLLYSSSNNNKLVYYSNCTSKMHTYTYTVYDSRVYCVLLVLVGLSTVEQWVCNRDNHLLRAQPITLLY